MNQLPATGDAQAASLVGSLSAFHLPEVLSLLARTTQGGELQVVGAGVDGRLWLEDGELTGSSVGSALTLTQAVFELGLLADGWFSFTEGRQAPAPAPRQSVASILDVVGPQVEEWHELLGRVPLDAVVRLSPEPPGAEVQIRADQWQVLTTVGNADMSVQDVVTALHHDQVVTLRLLRDLADAGLISVDGGDAVESSADAESPVEAVGSEPLGWPLSAASGSAPNTPLTGLSTPDAPPSLSDVRVMPPPISADPWTVPSPAEDGVTTGDGNSLA